jgi:D-amino-acid dehydrogenase
MRVAVLGAGVVGVATAWYLARAGHSVTVIDRAGRVASGASHANGAQLSYSFTDSLARPGFLRELPTLLAGRDPAVRLRARPSRESLLWAAAFLRQCTGRRASDNTLAMLRVALRSAALLDELMRQVPLAFSFTRAGKLVLVRRPDELDAARRSVFLKRRCGCRIELLAPEAAARIEPALQAMPVEYAAAIWSANDHVADARAFTERLACWLEEQGLAEFRMGEAVSRIVVTDGRLRAVVTSGGEYAPDAAVICLGTGSTALLRRLRVTVPILPLRGYSVTLPAGERAPTVSISDPRHRIVFSRLGEEVRIAGFADFVDSDASADTRRIEALVAVARRIAPAAADYGAANRQEWGGFRPMTPDGRPRVGPTGVRGLFLNTGHGMLGWTLACATAHDVSEAVVASAPAGSANEAARAGRARKPAL